MRIEKGPLDLATRDSMRTVLIGPRGAEVDHNEWKCGWGSRVVDLK